MKIKNIYIGSWFPKIKLHLDEFTEFLKETKTHPELDKKQAKKLHKKLKPIEIEKNITSKQLAEIKAKSKKDFDYSYYEDGLLLVKTKSKDFRKSRGDLVTFYQDTLTPCLAFIFSRGAKGLEIIRVPKLPKRIFFTTFKANKKSITEFFEKEKEKIDNWQNFKQFDAIFSENLVAINFKKKFTEDEKDEILQEFIFLTEINRHLYWLLQTHRKIWEKAQKILEEEKVQTKDLPNLIENLTIYFRNVVNIISRIDQMNVVLSTREKSLKTLDDIKWKNYFENKFKKTDLEIDYMKKLFIMTSKFLRNNINYLSSIYQQASEDSIRKLQFLFLVNVVSSFLVLGTIFGTNVYWYEQGQLIATGRLESFHVSVLIAFGFLTLLISTIIYYFWNTIYKNLTRKVKK